MKPPHSQPFPPSKRKRKRGSFACAFPRFFPLFLRLSHLFACLWLVHCQSQLRQWWLALFLSNRKPLQLVPLSSSVTGLLEWDSDVHSIVLSLSLLSFLFQWWQWPWCVQRKAIQRRNTRRYPGEWQTSYARLRKYRSTDVQCFCGYTSTRGEAAMLSCLSGRCP